MRSETDWHRLRTETNDPPPDDEDDFAIDWDSARVEPPLIKEKISLRVDADVLEFFRAQGGGYQTRMNAVLRAYMKARKSA